MLHTRYLGMEIDHDRALPMDSLPRMKPVQSATQLAWLLLVLWALLSACGKDGPSFPGVMPPQVFVQPAGGVFPNLPERIVLESSENAMIYYTLDGSRPTVKSQPYSAPIRLNDSDTTLRFFARDTARNHSRMQVERYRRVAHAPQITLHSARPIILGPQQRTTVRWVCEQRCGRFRLIAGDGGWERGVQLEAGVAPTGQEMHSTLSAARLHLAHGRLWVYVKSDEGILGAASLPLVIDRQAPQVRAWPAGGTYGALPNVALVTDEAATVYYTIDGSLSTRNSASYEAPIRLRAETTLRFLAVDRFGNQGTVQTETYRLRTQAPTVRLEQFPGLRLDVSTILRFTWRSSHGGHYLLSANGQPLLRGRVERNKPMHSTVHGWSLPAPHNRLRLRVTDDDGREGSTSFILETFFRETFARDAALDREATTAHWDATTGRITLPTGPLQRGSYETHHTSRGVASQGRYAYIANTRGGLQVLDLAAAEQARLVGHLAMYGEPKALAKYQQYVYLAADASGVQIFDVSDPQAPLLVGHQRLQGRATAIAITGARAYVGTQQHGLYLYDLTNPRHPRRLAHLPLGMPVMHLAATATHVYVAGFNAGVAIIDFTPPTMLRVLTTIPTGPGGEAVLGVAVHDRRLYVAASALTVFDVQDAAHPRRLARVSLSSAYGVAMHDDLAYVTDQYNGLRIVDVQAARPPHLLGTYDTPNRAVRLALRGHIAFVADMLGGLHLIDVSQPRHPTLLRTLPHLGQIVDVWAEGGFAYLANRKGRARLLVADVRHPRQARIVGAYRNGSLTDVVLSGPRAYVLDAFGGLQILDISQPQRPRLLGAQRTQGVAQGLTLYGPYALAAVGQAGLQVIDVAQPARPTTVAHLALPGESVDVVTWGRYAYIATGTGGIAVVDIARPDAPHLLGSVHPSQASQPEKIVRLAVDGPYLYASDSSPRLSIFSLARPHQPQLLRQVVSPRGTLWALTVHGRYLYATTILKHLLVFDVVDPTQPRLLAEVAGGARDLVVAAPHLLLATESYKRRGGGLRVLDIYAPHAPRSRTTWSAEVLDVATAGPHVYVATGQGGLAVGRFSSTGQFQTTARLRWHDTAQRLVLCGPQAYVGGQRALAVIDISVSTTPRLLSTMDLDMSIAALECYGNLLLVAGRDGLLVIDVSDPTKPSLQATLALPGGLRHMVMWGGGYVIGAGAEGRVMRFDLTMPSQPRLSGQVELALPVHDLTIYGHNAYIAAGASGLHVVPLQTAGPLQSHTIWSGEVQALRFWGRRAYAVDRRQGLVSLDFSNPNAPRQLEVVPWQSSPPRGIRLAATPTTLYLARGKQGLQRYSIGLSRTSVRVPQAVVQSLKVDTATQPLASVTLWAQAWPGALGHITYAVSNDGGDTWEQALPGVPHNFSALASDLRWRTILHGATGLADPVLYEIQLTYTLATPAP